MGAFSRGFSRRSVLASMAGGIAAGTLAPVAARAAAPDLPALQINPPLFSEDYAEVRKRFRTHLTKIGPSPDPSLPLTAPAGTERVKYRSGDYEFTAWLSHKKPATGLRPAVLVLHGGNVLGEGHWPELGKAYAEAGYSVIMPALRGENDQPGAYSCFYDEAADAVAAGEYLAALPGIDRNRFFVAGHSIGATHTLLVAMMSPMFRAASAFSTAGNVFGLAARFPELVVFDTSDQREFEMRSPVCYPGSFKCPLRISHGTEERRSEAALKMLVDRAKAAGRNIESYAVEGGHSSAVPEEIRRSIAFFNAA